MAKMEYGKTYVDLDVRYLKSIKKYQAQIVSRWVNEYGAKERDFAFFRQTKTKDELKDAITKAQETANRRFNTLIKMVEELNE
jgi:hypothetical protein